MKWHQLLVWLLATAWCAACAVNPVPTPSSENSAGGRTGLSDASADGGKRALDAAAAAEADATASDAAAAKDTGLDSGAGEPTVLPFDPTATDPAIKKALQPHRAWLTPAKAHSGKLVLFLGGTDSHPGQYDLLLAEAARLGHHVLGLHYPNEQSVAGLCGADLNCYEHVRRELLEGVDYSPKIAIGQAESIENRLIKALLWLELHDPGRGWGQFLSANKPKWAALIAAGLSLGAGQAALIGKLHAVDRVVLLAGVVDGSEKGPAAWISNNHLTESARYFGFAHKDDPLFARIQANWIALGMGSPGNAVDVDKAQVPYPTSQQLTTAWPTKQPHGSVGVDQATPMAGVVPRYRDAWRYLIGL